MFQEATNDQKINYYDLLGIKKEASSSDIKKAYYNLAVRYHPDKNLGNKEEKEECAKNFQKIHQAYQVLSNVGQRDLYNLLGAEDYNLLKSQNPLFQTFFDTAFKIKTSFETAQKPHYFNKNKSFAKKNQNRHNFQQVFQEFFEEESSSEEDEESSMSYNFFYTNKFYCNFQQNGFFQNMQTKTNFQPQQNFSGFSYQSNEKFSTNFTESSQKPADFNKKTNELDTNQKLLEKIKQKKQIFSINHNQIRKKK